MGQRRRYFRVADRVLHKAWSNDELAGVVRLLAFMHERWARDGLTPEQAIHCELGPSQVMLISGKRRADVALTSLQRLAHVASMSLEYRGNMALIDWPNFADFQGLLYPNGDHSSPKVVPTAPAPSSAPAEEIVRKRKRPRKGGVMELPIALEIGFEQFWAKYPKKVSKQDARNAWEKLSPTNDQISAMLNALNWQCELEDWQKDNGRYVPHPATYLNRRRWEDEPPPPPENPYAGWERICGYCAVVLPGVHAADCPRVTHVTGEGNG